MHLFDLINKQDTKIGQVVKGIKEKDILCDLLNIITIVTNHIKVRHFEILPPVFAAGPATENK